MQSGGKHVEKHVLLGQNEGSTNVLLIVYGLR